MNKLNKFNVLNYELYKSIIGDSGEFYSIPNDNPVTIPELKDEVPTDVFGYLPGKLNQALEKENFPVGFYYDKDKDFIENTFYVHTHGGKFRKLYSNLVSACEKESSFVKDIGLCVLDSYSKAKNFKHKLMPEGGIEDILEQSYSQVSVVIYTGSHFYVVFKNLYGNYYFLSDFNTCQISRDSFYSDINLTGFDSSEDCVLEYIVK